MKIALGSDHIGRALKLRIAEHLRARNIEFCDMGADSTERTHYPLFAEKVARAVISGSFERGILICGTGVGMSIAANKVKGVRAVVCSEPYSAQLSRTHNDTNILAMGARVVGEDLALMILDIWLDAEYEGGRHQTRLDMISKIETS